MDMGVDMHMHMHMHMAHRGFVMRLFLLLSPAALHLQFGDLIQKAIELEVELLLALF